MKKNNNMISILLIISFFGLLLIPFVTNKFHKEVIEKKEKLPKEVEKKIEEPVEEVIEPLEEKVENTQPVEEQTTPETPPETIKYTCPNGYNQIGTKCTHIMEANRKCPPNTTAYTDREIDRDRYCINQSEGIESDSEKCPYGYEVVRITNKGKPDKYYCYHLYEKIYTCEDGYDLSGTTCTKTIIANVEKDTY